LLGRLPSTLADRQRDAADKEATEQYWRDVDVCNGIDDSSAATACSQEALRTECASNIANFEAWAAKQTQHVNTAAQGFDRAALALVRWVEAQAQDAHAFAARTALDLSPDGPSMTGPDGQPMTQLQMAMWQLNMTYATILLQPHLSPGNGVDRFVTDAARWFDMQKSWVEGGVESSRQSLMSRCWPILNREALEALAQAEAEAYRESLWERMASTIEASWNPRIKCEASVDGFTASIDDSGAHSLSSKWKNFSASLDSTGKLTASAAWKWFSASHDSAGNTNLTGSWQARGISFSGRTTLRGGQVVATTLSASGSTAVAPFVTGKGGITLVSDGNPSGPSLAFSGSLSIGLQRQGFGGAGCTPGSGTLKIYPRAFTQAAVAYALAPR
jgi:hypothetical protein